MNSRELTLLRIKGLIELVTTEQSCFEFVGKGEQTLYGKIKNPHIPMRVSSIKLFEGITSKIADVSDNLEKVS